MSESGTKDDCGECVNSQHQQLQQQVQRTASITPPPTPHVAADSNAATVKDEPEVNFSTSSSSPSTSGLDASPMNGSSRGYGGQWYREPWTCCQPRNDSIYNRYWSAVDGGLRQWSRGCSVNEFDARCSGHQSYGDWDTGDCSSADYSSAVEPTSLRYQHVCHWHSPLYT